MPRGGKRIGAGRKRKSDPTVPIRVPLSKKEIIKQWLNASERTIALSQRNTNRLNKSLSILEKALKLKANAGGKIKNEIRLAIDLIKEV